MKRFILLLVVLIFILTISIQTTLAQGPTNIYVDTKRTGNEDGSKTNPYNSEKEGRAYLQSLPYGGNLYILVNGKWTGPYPVDPAKPGQSGTPLPKTTLYIILSTLALALILVGWQLQRRARQLQD